MPSLKNAFKHALAYSSLFFLFTSNTLALNSPTNFSSQTASSLESNPRDTMEDGHWKWVIAPYLWALSMNGSIQIKGQRAPVNQTFADILSDLNWAGMIWLGAEKGKFGVFLNLIYASLSQDASDRYISAKVTSNFGLYTAGLSYEAYKACLCTNGCQPGDSTLRIVPYIGARYTSNDASLTVNTPFGSVRGSNNQHWTDPLIGARLNFDLSKAWLLTVAGDIGGTNISSNYSYNISGLIGYKPQTIMKYTTWYLGYRLLDQLYTKGSSSNYFNWNMKLYGPIVGVSFTL